MQERILSSARWALPWIGSLALALAGCDSPTSSEDAGEREDASVRPDASTGPDTGTPDEDAGTDAGTPGDDAGGGADGGTDGGGDLCDGVDCSDLDDACNVGTCDPSDGTCSAVPVSDGTGCDDGDLCTTTDVCTAGVCGGAAVDCSASSDMCNVGTCDPTDGSCAPVPVTDGTGCDDGDLCTTTDVCTAGACAGGAVDCSGSSDMCNVGTCDPTDGSCDPVPVTDGTGCDDGSLCTTGDACTGGTCGGTAVDCSGSADMCNTGMCSPTTGSCIAVPVSDGTLCNDANMCTGTDVCTGGVCGGTTLTMGDTCGAALPLMGTDGVETVTGSITSCYTSAGVGTCGGDGRDVIYRLDLPAPRRTRFETIAPTGGGGYDTTLHIRTDCATPASQVACDDDGGGGTFSLLTPTLDAGTYFVYVDAFFASTSSGSYALEAELIEPNNCAGAAALTLPDPGETRTISGTTAGATNVFTAPTSCAPSGATGPDHVYSFTVATRTRLRFETVGAGSFDTVLHVRGSGGLGGGCVEGSAATVQCSDDVGTGLLSRIEADFDPGTYYLIVDGYDSAESGTYTLEMERYPSISRTMTVDTALRGSTATGILFDDECPAGQVLIGVNGQTDTAGGYFHRLQAVCGTLGVRDATTGTGYRVVVTAGTTLTMRGGLPGTAVSSACPSDNIVIGFGGRAGSLVDQLVLRCAPLTITGDAASGFTVGVGPSTDRPAIGGTGGTAFPQTDCPAGDVAGGAIIRAGASIDAFGLSCAEVTSP